MAGLIKDILPWNVLAVFKAFIGKRQPKPLNDQGHEIKNQNSLRKEKARQSFPLITSLSKLASKNLKITSIVIIYELIMIYFPL